MIFFERKTKDTIRPLQCKLSIVVCFRNEAIHINALIEALYRQIYPKHSLELILVNDHSEDASLEVLDESLSQYPFPCVKVVNLEEGEGKKKALEHGVQLASNDFVLCTDADCVPQPYWISSMVSQIKPDTGMILGGVFYRCTTWFHRLQEVEQKALMLLTLGSAKAKCALMSNGASMLFRKDLFRPFDGTVASGDDIFLLQRMKKGNYAIECQHITRDSIVQTSPNSSWLQLRQQKVRWASKVPALKDKQMLFSGAFLLFNQVVVAIVLPIAFFRAWDVVLILLVLKFLLELVGIMIISNKLRQKCDLIAAALVLPFYSYYMLLITCASLSGSYTWKGRKHSR